MKSPCKTSIVTDIQLPFALVANEGFIEHPRALPSIRMGGRQIKSASRFDDPDWSYIIKHYHVDCYCFDWSNSSKLDNL